jgi:hypothetical protein
VLQLRVYLCRSMFHGYLSLIDFLCSGVYKSIGGARHPSVPQ